MTDQDVSITFRVGMFAIFLYQLAIMYAVLINNENLAFLLLLGLIGIGIIVLVLNLRSE